MLTHMDTEYGVAVMGGGVGYLRYGGDALCSLSISIPVPQSISSKPTTT